MKKNRIKFILAMVLCFSFILTGCSSSGGNVDEDGNVTLDFWSIYPEGDPNYEWTLAKVKAFEDTHPNIKVNYTGISFWDYFTKITTAMTDPSGPDVYIQSIKDTNDRAKGGVSMNLTPFFDDTFNAGEEFFYKEDILPMTYEENVYGIPYALDNRVLYYNIDLMNALKDTTDEQWTATKVGKKDGTTITGRPADLIGADGNVRAPQTYDELLAYQELLTVQENGKITQVGFDVNIGNCMFVNVIWSNGGNFFDADGTPTLETDPGVRKGYEVWYELTHTLSSAKVNAFLDTAGETTENLFWSGRVALMISTNEVPWKNDKLGDQKLNIGAAPIPYNNNEENHYNFSGGFSLEIANKLSKESEAVQKAAFEFVKYMASPEVQVEVLTETSNMPGSVKAIETLTKEITDPVKLVVLDEMNYRKPYDYIFDAPNWFGEVQNAVTDFEADKKTLDQTLSRTQKAIQQLKDTY